MYQQLIQFLTNHNAPYSTSTLGGQSQVIFSLASDGDGISITNSSNNSYTFSGEECRLIINRYEELPSALKLVSSQYNPPIWVESPNLVFAPYLPALIRDLQGRS